MTFLEDHAENPNDFLFSFFSLNKGQARCIAQLGLAVNFRFGNGG